MRHSLFYPSMDDAKRAKQIVLSNVANVIDCYLSNDGESAAVEVRFFTDAPVEDFDQRYLMRRTRPEAVAFNCED